MILSPKCRAGAIRLVIICAAVFVLGIALWWRAFFFKEVLPKQVELSGEQFVLEAVTTEKSRGKGLGGRESLCQSCAMLFVFEQPGQYAFWMKDMHFPIDIVWLSRDRVVFVAHEVSPDFSGILDPVVVADRVIEFNAGVAKNTNVGERLQFSH